MKIYHILTSMIHVLKGAPGYVFIISLLNFFLDTTDSSTLSSHKIVRKYVISVGQCDLDLGSSHYITAGTA